MDPRPSVGGSGTALTLHFAYHFLLAPEASSCLSAVSKNLPAGGRGLGKECLISRFHSQISTELNGCVL